MTDADAELWRYTYHERLGMLCGTAPASDELEAMARNDADEAIKNMGGITEGRETRELAGSCEATDEKAQRSCDSSLSPAATKCAAEEHGSRVSPIQQSENQASPAQSSFALDEPAPRPPRVTPPAIYRGAAFIERLRKMQEEIA